MANRKYIRIALSADDEVKFSAAKAKAEQATGISMSDSVFALSIIRHHIQEAAK